MMGTGVVLDTSFLITLADSNRDHHTTARRYWRHFMESEMPVFLPTIVVAEFCVRQEIPSDILRCCVILPFNWDEAMKAAEFWMLTTETSRDSRVALKDDLKIIAQAAVREAGHLITDDVRTMCPAVETIRDAGKAQLTPIKLADGYDRGVFENGQGHFDGMLDEVESEDEE